MKLLMRDDCALGPEMVEPEAAGERPSGAVVLRVDALYDDYLDKVWRTLLRLGVSESLVEDAAHEVFVVLHRRLADFEERATIGTYIYAITLRVAQCFRRLHHKHRGDELPEGLAHGGPDPETCLEQKRAAALLQQLLGKLTDEQREVFVLSELEELSAPEIAQVLGIPVNTVYSRLRLGRLHFDRVLSSAQASISRRQR